MAGDWIMMDLDLPEKPEVFQIADALGLDEDAVVGKLFKVWRWFDRQTESGNAAGVTLSRVDRIAGVAGFADAMKNTLPKPWLAITETGIELPHFDKRNGKTAKNRALTNRRVQAHRGKSGNAYVTLGALPREEKRIEEKKPLAPDPKPAKPKREPKGETSIDDFLATIPEGGKVFEPGCAVLEYAKSIDLPAEYLKLAWREFVARMKGSSKRYKDWRAAFLNYLRGDYLKLWYINDDGYQLTRAGIQAQRAAVQA